MYIQNKTRKLKFSGIAALAAAIFCLVMFVGVSRTIDADMIELTALAAIASGAAAWISWSLLMRAAETKFRGAWAGILAVLIAYPIMALFMTVLDTSTLSAVRYFQVTLMLSLTMTGIFTVPLGGILGHWAARNVDGLAQ